VQKLPFRENVQSLSAGVNYLECIMPRRVLILLTLFSVSFTCTICLSSYSRSVGREGNWSKGAQDSPNLESCKKLAEAQPENAVAQNDYGWALRLHGENQEAEKYLSNAKQLDPSLAYVHSNLSVVELDLKKPQEALGEAKRAVDIDSKQPIFHVVYGNALAATGDTKAAIKEYQAAIEQRPDYENAYYNLGRVYQINGQKTEALAALSKALELDSKDERALKLMDETAK
jgi:tetratricopeptide (TPR) repeat protein